MPLPTSKDETQSDVQVRLFYDDTPQAFCRRLCFTPDGELLIAPAGLLELPYDKKEGEDEKSVKPKRINATYVFSRQHLGR